MLYYKKRSLNQKECKMKKKILLALSILILSSTCTISYSKNNISEDMANAIKLYKAANYSECYARLDDIIKNDPANALAYYYKAMSAAQIGRKDEAIENYDKAIVLTPSNSNLNHYASKGKNCLESPDMCYEALYDSIMDKFIRSKEGNNFSEAVQSEHDRLKLEQLKRMINTDEEIKPQQFRDYKDFSRMNYNANPTNDDIVAAMRVLQKAGLYGNGINNGFDFSSNGLNPASLSAISGMASMNPQLIQAMFSNNMSLGF